MRVLVLGGTGFVGPHVVRRLVERGEEVTVVHRGRSAAALPKSVRHLLCPERPLGDRSYDGDLAERLLAFAPEIVLDMVPVTKGAAAAVVELFRGRARRLIAISSQDVYRAYGMLLGTESGPPIEVPMTEEAPLRRKLFPYRGVQPRATEDPRRWMDDYDKVLVESVVMGEPELPGTILRFPMVYGPGDRQHRMYEYLRRMIAGRPAILLEEAEADWCWTRGYAENLADAVVLAITDDRAAGEIYNVGEPDTPAMRQWVAAIGEAAGWEGEILAVPREVLPEELQTPTNTEQHLMTDSSKIRDQLGYAERVSRGEAIAATVAWEREHPPEGAAADEPNYAAEDGVLARLGEAT